MRALVYVAASSREVYRAVAAMDALRKAGIEVPFDWTRRVIAEGTASLDQCQRNAAVAYEEVAAVRRSNFLWLLIPEHGSTGAGFESGIAYERGIPLIISGPFVRRFFFGLSARAEFLKDADALEWILDRSVIT